MYLENKGREQMVIVVYEERKKKFKINILMKCNIKQII